MRFWDSSAMTPLLIRESTSQQVRALFEQDPNVLLWWGARLEVISALARALREGVLSQAEIETARGLIDELVEGANIVEPTNAVSERAERLLMVHNLRAADALHLAAALIASKERPNGHGFVCLDKRLCGAASREGFSVLPHTF